MTTSANHIPQKAK